VSDVRKLHFLSAPYPTLVSLNILISLYNFASFFAYVRVSAFLVADKTPDNMHITKS
jgi:hypothetical protein